MMFKQRLALFLYQSVTKLLHPLAYVFLVYRLKKGKEDSSRINERRGTTAIARPKGKLFWFHAASVGEFMSLMPLLERLEAHDVNILVTTGTLTSANIAAQRLPKTAIHQFIPLDIPVFVKRFLGHWKPDLAIFTESEIWPNLISYTAKNAIPIGIVNGRMSARSYNRWQKMPSLISALLTKIDFCLTQTQSDADRFSRFGTKRTLNVGNLKFDCNPLPYDQLDLKCFAAATQGRHVWLAASTHEGEETIIIDAYQQIKQRYPHVLCVIVPRHPERGRHILKTMLAHGLNVKLRSKAELPCPETDIFIADTMGELGLFYRACPIAFIGNSLVSPGGGHNPIEAAQLGATVLYGPHIKNFTLIYSALEGDGCLGVNTAKDISDALDRFFAPKEYCHSTVEVLQKKVGNLGGAAEKTMNELEIYIKRQNI